MPGIGSLDFKLKGINITPWFNNLGFTDWDGIYSNWSTAFPLIKDLIDIAIADMGVNCFRIIGAPDAVLSGTPLLTESLYLARYSEIISYCRSKGCYFEATGCGWQNLVDRDTLVPFSDAAIFNHLRRFAVMANDYDNVVGIDLIQEFNGWGKAAATRTEAQNVTFVDDLITAAKADGVTKPLSCSIQPWGTYDNLFDQTVVAAVAPYVDYLNFHVYYYPFDPADMDPALEHGKPIYIGEVAVAKSGELSYGGNRLAFTVSLQTTILDENITGLSFWALNDDATEGDNFPWGLYDNLGVPYDTDVIESYAAVPAPAPVPFDTVRKIPTFMFR
jgi:hypothetical protein